MFFSDEYPTIMWTGYGKKTPVLVFKPDAIVSKKPDFRTIGGITVVIISKAKFSCTFDTTSCFFKSGIPLVCSTKGISGSHFTKQYVLQL